jgi:two-component system cell cycle sensor histidine kinase/response regulator CckA
VRVLVVDDHETVRHMASRLLACLGHQASEAAGGDEAEATLDPDVELVLLDLGLADTDGATLAQRLEAVRGDLRILFMSGDGREVFEARALSGPRRAFIEKPFSLRALSAAVDGLMAR